MEIIPRYTITFEADGGNFAEGETGERITNDAMQIESLPEVSKEGFHFLGWYVGTEQINLDREYFANTQITAKWQQIYIDGRRKPWVL